MRPDDVYAPPPERSILAGVLSYLVPGLGQIVQGRVGKGLLFMVVLLGMFTFGQALGSWKNVYLPPPDEGRHFGNPPPAGRGPRAVIEAVFQRWHYAGQFFIGVAAWPALWQFFDLPMPEGEFWRTYQRGPRTREDEDAINTLLVNSDKAPDVGWIYTVIAGMLNLLVIYDAFAGPAHPRVLRSGRDPQPGELHAAGQGVSA